MSAAPIRVLVIDDERAVRELISDALKIEGHDVHTADNGKEGLDLIGRNRFDLVFCDLRMPEMDGLEATRRITSDPALSRTRVLVLTTFELDEYVFGALDAGASGFLLKGGELDGQRIRGARTVHHMTSNHLGPDIKNNVANLTAEEKAIAARPAAERPALIREYVSQLLTKEIETKTEKGAGPLEEFDLDVFTQEVHIGKIHARS